MWFRFVPWIASLVRRRHISGQTDRSQGTDVSLLFAFVRPVLFVSLHNSHGLEWQVTEFYAIIEAILPPPPPFWRRFKPLVLEINVNHFFKKFHFLPHRKGTAVAQWLRYCATNRKVAGSTPDGVFGFFRWRKPSDRTMTLGSTQPLTEISTRSISWG
jgi:hypothetical protein